MENNKIIGVLKEGVTAPRYNTGARRVLGKMGVSVVSVGHDHCNDYCLKNSILVSSAEEDKQNSIWLCYGGAAGEGGYGGYGGTPRRARVFEVNSNSNNIYTWKRVEGDEEDVLDKQLLVSGGLASD